MQGGAPETVSDYREGGGYSPGRYQGPALIGAVEAAGLRGRGGAAFPAGVKWRAVAARPGPRVLIANGEEGEPSSVKDRWLLRHRPHLVLDGLLRAAAAIDASRSIVYVSDMVAADRVRGAIDELGVAERAVEVFEVAPSFVAGEETAAVRAIDGGPAKPLSKPPRPFEAGVEGKPTLVANVETLANVPLIARHGPEWFRGLGTEDSPGTFLATLSGSGVAAGLYEFPLGTPLGVALDLAGGVSEQPRGFLMGGFFGGMLGPEALGVRLDYESLGALGSGLGCGAIVVLGPRDCPVRAATGVMAYFARANAAQCGACMNGTEAMHRALAQLTDGSADRSVLERLRRWSVTLRGRGACATLDGAARLVASLLDHFAADVESHLDLGCSGCDAWSIPPVSIDAFVMGRAA